MPDTPESSPDLSKAKESPANPSTTSSRKPLLANQPGPEDTPAPAKARAIVTGKPNIKVENSRQHKVSWTAMIVMSVIQFVILAGLTAWGIHTYRTDLLPRMGSAAPAIVAADTKPLEVSLDQARAQISALQRQLDAGREEREKTQSRLQEMADRMALVIQQSSFVPSPDATRATDADASQIAAMLPTVSPAMSELILLKERNRLTDYADKAIATGSRESLEALVEAMMDPEMKHLATAAQAEFKRVRSAYDVGINIDPGYTLPVQELFKGQPISREVDLTPAQLHTLLQDTKQPWEVRLRSAYLLRSSSDKDTTEILLKVIQEDPMLDVAKQAQISFENRVGRRFRLFDIPALLAWWEAQGAAKEPAVKMIEPKK